MAEPWVAEVQGAIDRQRLEVSAPLFHDAGLSDPAAKAAAQSVYALLIGAEILRLSGPLDMKSMLIAHIKSLLGDAP